VQQTKKLNEVVWKSEWM